MACVPTTLSLNGNVPFFLGDTCLSILKDALARIGYDQLVDLPKVADFEGYTKRTLVDTPALVVSAARWRAGACSPLHGHSDSAGLYRVVTGALEEQRFVPVNAELKFSIGKLAAGDESYLPSGSFHQLRAIEDSVTIHAYSPRPVDSVSGISDEDQLRIDRARAEFTANRFEQPA